MVPRHPKQPWLTASPYNEEHDQTMKVEQNSVNDPCKPEAKLIHATPTNYIHIRTQTWRFSATICGVGDED
jgi:hypothetical protein